MNHSGQPGLLESTRPALAWTLSVRHADGSVNERACDGYAALFDGRPDPETDSPSGTRDDRPLDTDRYA